MSKDKDVVVKTDFIPSVQTQDELGVETLPDEGMSFPKLKIVQGTTQNPPSDAKPGDFYNSITNEVFGKSLILIPIYFWQSRILFNEKFEILCRSFKGVTPDMGKISKSCAVCPKSQWGENNKAPDCQLTFNYVVITQKMLDGFVKGNVDLPMIYMGHGAMMGRLKKMNSMIKAKAMGSQHIPMYAQKFTFTTKMEKFETGQAYMADIEYFGLAGKDEFEALKKIFSSVKEVDMKGALNTDDEASNTQPL